MDLKIQSNHIIRIALLLLFLPTFLFTFFFLKWPFAIVCVGCLSVVFYISCKKAKDYFMQSVVEVQKRHVAIISLVILILTVVTGIGGLFPQSADHLSRNPVFRDLIFFEWPVVYHAANTALTYYFGFYLLPALIGKFFLGFLGTGAAWVAANLFLIVQTALYCTIIVLLIAALLPIDRCKMNFCFLIPLFVFGYSGLHIVGAIINWILTSAFELHLEHYNTGVGLPSVYSSTWLAFSYVYQQAVPAFLASLLFMMTKKSSVYLAIAIPLLVTSPLALLGLAILMVCQAIWTYKSHISLLLKDCFSLPNLLILPVGLLVVPFYFNLQDSSIGWINPFSIQTGFLRLVIFWVLEFGLLALLLLKKNRSNSLFYFCIILLMVIPIFTVNGKSDFSLKVSTVPLTCMMVLLIKQLYEDYGKDVTNMRRILTVAYLTLALLSVSIRMAEQWRIIFLTGQITDTYDVIKTFSNKKTTMTEWYIPQYIKRNPSADFFYSSLSRANLTEIRTPDIILEESQGATVVYREEDIAVLESVGIAPIGKAAHSYRNGILYLEESQLSLNIEPLNLGDMTIELEVGSYSHAVRHNSTLATRNPTTVAVQLTNRSPYTIWDSNLTTTRRGLVSQTINPESGEILSYNIVPLEVTIKPGESIEQVINLFYIPEEPGMYALVIYFFEDGNGYSPYCWTGTIDYYEKNKDK